MFNSFLIVLEQVVLYLPLILGSYIGFSLLKIPDLSIETAYVFGAIMGSKVLLGISGAPALVAFIVVVAASLAGGAVVGFVSSVLTQKAGLPHLLSSIITFGIFHGINQFISSSYVSLSGKVNPLIWVEGLMNNTELVSLLCISGGVIFFNFLLLRTQIGYAFAVYGNNPYFFANYGISSSYVFITGVMLGNALAGLSGYLFAQSNNFLEINMGVGKSLLCITALILGKIFCKTGKRLSLGGVVGGTIAYFSLQQFLLKIGFNLKYFTAVQACIVLAILVYIYRNKTENTFIDNLGV